MAAKVIVTGNPRGQVVTFYGKKILPGGRYTMDKDAALGCPRDIIILEEKIENLEPPKPEVREKAADVLKDDDADKAIAAAEGGRIDKGSQQRKIKG